MESNNSYLNETLKDLPVKKITRNDPEIRAIILERIRVNFYNKDSVKQKVFEKLLKTLLNFPES